MLTLTASQIDAVHDAGLRLLKQDDLFGARQKFDQLRLAVPNAPKPYYQIARIDLKLGRPRRAKDHLEKALSLAPGDPRILAELGAAYAACGQHEDAVSIHDQRIKADPDNLAPWMDKAVALQQAGRFDEAEKVFRKVAPRARVHGDFYRIWFATNRPKSQSEKRLRDALKLWEHPKLSGMGRMHLGFALAGAMEGLGEYDRVFAFLDRANAIQSAQAPYDRAERQSRMEELYRTAPSGPVARDGASDAHPVFLIGMPRSGTTLFERILAAHPQVRAGGEIGQARQMAYQTFGHPGDMRALADISGDDLALYADRYWTSSSETAAGDAPVITDKSMQNQFVMGYAARSFPKARFVIVRRDPHDVALSIYKNHFALGSHRYASNLADIAHQMRTFDAAIAHWKDKIDMVEIRYEDLTADPETQSRALVAAAGLPWNEACLDHTKAKGAVTTLSIAQVRQPIYKTSAGGWQRYGDALHLFTEAWESKA